MSIAILFNQKESADWLKRLKELLPEEKIEVYPEIENKSEVEFLVVWKPHIDYYKEFPNLKVIQSVGAGIDNLYPNSLPKNIIVTRIVDPELKQDMFEHILTCILTEMKNFSVYEEQQKNRVWFPKKYSSINTTTIMILGLGEIGGFVASNLVKLGFKVKGWSITKKEIEGVENFTENELEKAICKSDFIVNILPLTSKTNDVLNKKFFNYLSPQTTLINVGRGSHLIENDLVIAIKSGQIKSAYLDVFPTEPLDDVHPFWTNKNIHITPHIASITNPETAILQVVNNYKFLKENLPLNNTVDLEKGY